MSLISLIKFSPSVDMSSNLPIKGETYVAPAFAARRAWPTEKTSVQLVFIPLSEKYLKPKRKKY